jgi:hypothetical protein
VDDVANRRRWSCFGEIFRKLLSVLAAGLIMLGSGAAAAEEKLPGSRIRAMFAGMQLTDEVHYRFVYERDGTFRSYSLGVKKVGKWTVEKDELCLYLGETDDGCYQVTVSGDRIEMTPSGLGGTLDGILQPAYRN